MQPSHPSGLRSGSEISAQLSSMKAPLRSKDTSGVKFLDAIHPLFSSPFTSRTAVRHPRRMPSLFSI